MLSNKYRIQRIDDFDLAPEETFAESSSEYSSLEIPLGRGVFRFFWLIALTIIVLLISQSFRLQIMQGKRFALLADQSRLNHYSIPALRGVIYDAQHRPLAQNVPVFDLVAIRSELLKADRPEYAEILETNKNNAIFTVKRNLTKEEAIRYQSAHISGLYVVSYAKRSYSGGLAFSHILGYTAQITEDELRVDYEGRYQHNDRVGRLGVEASYESTLHGDPQSVALEPGVPIQVGSAIGGSDIVLTIDQDVQQQLYKSLDQILKENGVRRGAAIVQDIKTGAVLGMVSMPAFDPNIFENSSSEQSTASINAILEDKNKPLFNRVISGLYAPGSTIKPLYALAALSEKIIDPRKQILANGAIQVQSQVDPTVTYTFRDWKVHGWTDMRKAIADSVDVYFYAIGGGYGDQRGMGVDTISRYLKKFLADRKTGIDLPLEATGFVPTKQWKKDLRGESWYIGDTYNLSIGQGDLTVSPIWINTYVGAIANGGKLMQPYLVQSSNGPKVLGSIAINAADLQVVREGMRQTVTDGTAQLLKDLPRQVAAKTGTAQVTGKNLNSLFTVYGPYEDPHIVMTVLIEQIPQSQSLAVRVANKFLAWYFIRQ